MKKSYCLVLAVGALVWACVFALTLMTPAYFDDFALVIGRHSGPGGWSFETGDWSAAFSVREHLSFIVRTYLTWGGRFLAWLVTYPLNLCPKWVFASVNATMWLCLSWLAWRLSGLGARGFAIVCAWMLVFCLHSEAVLWLTGSFSYLIALVPALAVSCWLLSPRSALPLPRPAYACGPVLAAVGALSVGGHELVAATVGAAVGVYAVVLAIRERRLPQGRRMPVMLGCLLGAALCVLAPGNFARMTKWSAPSVPTQEAASLSFLLKEKCLNLAHVFIDNPSVPLMLAVFACAIAVRPWRRRCPLAAWAFAAAAILNLAMALAMTGAVGRTCWFAAVLAAIAVLCLFRAHPPSRPLLGVLTLAFASAAAVVVVQTAQTTWLRRQAYERMARDIVMSTDGCVRGESLGIANRSWLDRSLASVFEWGISDDRSIARSFGKDAVFVLEDWVYDFVHDGSSSTNGVRRLKNAPSWVFDPNADSIVYGPMETDLESGTPVVVRPTYDASGLTPTDKRTRRQKWKDNLDMVLRRDQCAWTLAMPWQEIVSDKPMKGFVVRTRRGAFVVAHHNRRIDRDRILSLEVEILPSASSPR